MELLGDDAFWSGPALRLARPEAMDEEEERELVGWRPESVGWVLRDARDERRGDIIDLLLYVRVE